MSDLLSRLSRVWFRRSAARAGARRFAPRLELLEDRTVPAGQVKATQIGGVLTITAVNDPNDVNILNTNHQNITLDGAGGNDITVSANDGETGTAITDGPFNNVTKIKLIMGLGNDTVTITNTTLTGLVDFKGGSGDNNLQIDGAGNFSGEGVGNNTLGSVKVTNGDGFDIFTIGGGQHTINGSVTINNGQGGSNTTVNFQPANTATIGGTFSVTNLTGLDQFGVFGNSATFTGKVTIRNGNGDSDTEFFALTNTLTGGLSVSNGAGNDDFDTGGTTFIVGTAAARRNLTISNGSGEDNTDQTFNATTHTINGNLVVTALSGDNDLNVNGTSFSVLGSVTVQTGNGNGDSNSTRVDISPTTLVDIDGAVRVTCREGAHTLSFAGTTVNLGSLTFRSGNGTSLLEFIGGTTTVGGGITSSHGDGFDRFDVSNTAFTAAGITLKNGAGGSLTGIEATTSNTITGAISITNGDGFDDFRADGATWTLGSATARRNLTIQNGGGGSTTAFQGSATVTIHGNFSLTNGDGFDELNDSSVALQVSGSGSVTIRHGNGGSSTEFGQIGASTIGGKLSVTGTDGDDDVRLETLTVNGATLLNLGNGDDNIAADNSSFAAFKLTAGAGVDRVQIESFIDNDSVTNFSGAVSINLGVGNDGLQIGQDSNDFAAFAAAVTLVGGLDLDFFEDDPNNAYNNPPVTSGFEQVT